jgi:ribosome recycling factor
MRFPDAVIRIQIPDISEEERSRRMKAIHKAAEEVLKHKERLEKRKCVIV